MPYYDLQCRISPALPGKKTDNKKNLRPWVCFPDQMCGAFWTDASPQSLFPS